MYDVDYALLLKEGVMTANASWPVRDCQAWEYNISTTGNYHSIVSEVKRLSVDLVPSTKESIRYNDSSYGGSRSGNYSSSGCCC